MGNNFGGLTVPLFTGFYIAKGEWQTGFLLIGGITLFISFLSMLFISDTPQISKKESINGLDSKTNYLSGDTLQQTIKSETFYLIFFSALLGTFLYSAVLPQMGDHLVSLFRKIYSKICNDIKPYRANNIPHNVVNCTKQKYYPNLLSYIWDFYGWIWGFIFTSNPRSFWVKKLWLYSRCHRVLFNNSFVFWPSSFWFFF